MRSFICIIFFFILIVLRITQMIVFLRHDDIPSIVDLLFPFYQKFQIKKAKTQISKNIYIKYKK